MTEPKKIEFSARSYSIECPAGCGGEVVASFVLEPPKIFAEFVDSGGTTFSFNHTDPPCDAFEEGDVLALLIEALREGKFKPNEKEN